METRSLTAIPFELTPNDGSTWGGTDLQLQARAPAHSDLFVDPSGISGVAAETQDNAMTLLGVPPAGDWVFSARVRVGFRNTFDAGVLLLRSGVSTWAKLCFEYSPHAQPMIVSVVTRGLSDDANGFAVDEDAAWLRVSRIGALSAFHASVDGKWWHFVRAFSLPDDGQLRLGFEAQSPTGDGCDVTFDRIEFDRRTLAQLRDGS